HIKELHQYPFLTNSDAHSLGKMGREYGRLFMKEANFNELQKVLRNEAGRLIRANYGLNPLLGKYYQSVCLNCGAQIDMRGDQVKTSGAQINLEMAVCSACGGTEFIKGVSARIKELSDVDVTPVTRPPYIHQVPLDFIPGLGPKTMKRLLQVFET